MPQRHITCNLKRSYAQSISSYPLLFIILVEKEREIELSLGSLNNVLIRAWGQNVTTTLKNHQARTLQAPIEMAESSLQALHVLTERPSWPPFSEHTSMILFHIERTGEIDPTCIFNSSALIRRPMLTQCGTATFLFGAGDVIAQQWIERKGRDHDVCTTCVFHGVFSMPCKAKWRTLLMVV